MVETLENTVREASTQFKNCAGDGYLVEIDGQESILTRTKNPDRDIEISRILQSVGINTPSAERGETDLTIRYDGKDIHFNKDEYALSDVVKGKTLAEAAKASQIDYTKLATSIAEFHTKMMDTDKLGPLVDDKTERDMVKEKAVARLADPSPIRQLLSRIYAFEFDPISKLNMQDNCAQWLHKALDRESIIHGDMTADNILTDGEDFYFIDFGDMRNGYLARDLARISMCLSAINAPGFDEKTFKENYLKALNRGLSERDIEKKTEEDFDEQFSAAKKLTGIMRATTYMNCEGREGFGVKVPAHVKACIYGALEEMTPKEKRAFARYVDDNQQNRYSRNILQMINTHYKENASLLERGADSARRIAGKYRGIMATAASLLLAVGSSYVDFPDNEQKVLGMRGTNTAAAGMVQDAEKDSIGGYKNLNLNLTGFVDDCMKYTENIKIGLNLD